MPNKAIFWDFDGTLNNRSGMTWKTVMRDALAASGYNVDFEILNHHMGRQGKSYSWDNTELSYTDAVGQAWWDTLFGNFGVMFNIIGVADVDRHKIKEYFMNDVLNPATYILYEDATATLAVCAGLGYRNYLLSNNFPELPLIVRDLGLDEYFSGYFVSANIGYEKPRIELFNIALAAAGFPDIAYMVGDNPVADIQGGNAAGIITVLVNFIVDSEADYTCAALSDIPAILQ